MNELYKMTKNIDEVVSLVTVGIIGIGRMGAQLAKIFADHCDLWLYDQDSKRSDAVAKELGVKTAQYADLFSLEALVVALPTPVMETAFEQLAGKVKKNQVLVNIATTQPKEPLEAIIGNKAKVISAKIIGHAYEIAQGEKPIVVVDGEDYSSVQKVVELFKNLGEVVTGDEAIVPKLNSMASAEGIKAAYIIKEAMQAEGIPMEFWKAAVRNVAAGTMKAYASGDAGPFARQVIAEMEGVENESKGDEN